MRRAPVAQGTEQLPSKQRVAGSSPARGTTSILGSVSVRLKDGESQLAVSPLCGTNLAVAGILAGLASLVALGGGRSRLERLPNVLMAAVVAVVGAQPLGRLVQRYVTTSSDVQGLEIVAVTTAARGLAPLHKVKTAFRAG